MIGARKKRDDNKNNRCNRSYIIWTRSRVVANWQSVHNS